MKYEDLYLKLCNRINQGPTDGNQRDMSVRPRPDPVLRHRYSSVHTDQNPGLRFFDLLTLQRDNWLPDRQWSPKGRMGMEHSFLSSFGPDQRILYLPQQSFRYPTTLNKNSITLNYKYRKTTQSYFCLLSVPVTKPLIVSDFT